MFVLNNPILRGFQKANQVLRQDEQYIVKSTSSGLEFQEWCHDEYWEVVAYRTFGERVAVVHLDCSVILN